MRDAHDAIVSEEGQVIGVGMGTPPMAADAAATEKIPFPLVIDPGMDLYRTLAARRGSALSMLSPAVLMGALRAYRRGHRQVGVRADPMQLGATAIVDRGGEIVDQRAARHAADHPSVDWILRAVRKARLRSNP